MQIQNSKSLWNLGQCPLKRLENTNSSLSSCSSILSFEPSIETSDYAVGNISTRKSFEKADPVNEYIQTAGNGLGVPSIKPPLKFECCLEPVEWARPKIGKPSQESLLEGCVAQLSNTLSPVDANVFRSPCRSVSNKPLNCDLDFSFDSSPFCNNSPAAEKVNTHGRSPAYFDYVSQQRSAASPNMFFVPINASHPYQPPKSKLSPSEKLHNCKYCGKPYQNLNSLKNHHQKHETGNMVVKRHKCPFCAYSSQYHRNLLKHVDAAHCQQNYFSATSPVNVLAKNFEGRQIRSLLAPVPVVSESLCTLASDNPLPPPPPPPLLTNASDNPLSPAQSLTLRKKQSIAELLCSSSPETQNFIDAHSFSPLADLRPSSLQSLVGAGGSHNNTVGDSARPLPFNNESAERPGSAEAHKCMVCGKTFRSKQKLTHHMDTHDTRKPYFCVVPGCERAFSTPKYLQNHMSDYHGKGNAIRCPAENCQYVCNRQVYMKRHMAEKHPYKKINNCSPRGHSRHFEAETALETQGNAANSETPETLMSARTNFSSLTSLTMQAPCKSSVSTEIIEFDGPVQPNRLSNVFSLSSNDRFPQNAEFYHRPPSSYPSSAPISTSHTRPYPLFDFGEPPHRDPRDLRPIEMSPSYASPSISTYNKRAATFFEQPSVAPCPKLFRSPCADHLSYRPNDAEKFSPSVLSSANKTEASDIDVTFTELNAVLSRDLDEMADKVKTCRAPLSPVGQNCEIAHLIHKDISCRSPSLYGSTDSGNGSLTSARSLGGSTCGISIAEVCSRLENGPALTGDLASFSCSPPTPLNSLISCYNSSSFGDKISSLSSTYPVPSAASGGHRQPFFHCGNTATNFDGYFQPAKQQRLPFQSPSHSRLSTLSEQDSLYQSAASWEHARQLSSHDNKELIVPRSNRPVSLPRAVRNPRQHAPCGFGQPSPDYLENPFSAHDYPPPTSNVLSNVTWEKNHSDSVVLPLPPTADQQSDVGLESNFRTLPPYSSVYQPSPEFGTCARSADYNDEVGDDVGNLGPGIYYNSPFPPVAVQSPKEFYEQKEMNPLHCYPPGHRMPCGSLCTVCPRTIPQERFYPAPQNWREPDYGPSSDKCPPLRTYFDGSQPNNGSGQTPRAFEREPRAYILQQTELGNFVGDEVGHKSSVRVSFIVSDESDH
uniref:Zinc finger protein PLAGL1 n=1 Tax=Schistocephalus solidus TaxID=70667 RepID=A0A0X3PI14_SCHSO